VDGWLASSNFELWIRPVMFYATIVAIKMRGVRHNMSADKDENKRGHKMGRTSTCRHPFGATRVTGIRTTEFVSAEHQNSSNELMEPLR
jgi:hypothetical protein